MFTQDVDVPGSLQSNYRAWTVVTDNDKTNTEPLCSADTVYLSFATLLR